jgi:AraC family transcriptional regulator
MEHGNISGRCAAMKVTYFTRIEGEAPEHASNAIEIAIPGEHATVQAAYRASDGQLHRACVRAPLVSVVPPRQPHAFTCEEPVDLVAIEMEADFVQRKSREVLGTDALQIRERYASVDPFLREIGNTLRAELRQGREPGTGYLQALADVLAVHVTRNYCVSEAASSAGGLPAHKLHRVRNFILENLTSSIRVDQLAAAVHMSPYHFARMFKRATGQPPHAYVIAQRMERAKDLLRNSDLPLIDIAGRVGFRTQGHFTSVFHQYTGFTPRVFRLHSRAAA